MSITPVSKVTYVDGTTVIHAANLNEIQTVVNACVAAINGLSIPSTYIESLGVELATGSNLANINFTPHNPHVKQYLNIGNCCQIVNTGTTQNPVYVLGVDVPTLFTKILAGSNVTITRNTETGAITINATGGGGGGSYIAGNGINISGTTIALKLLSSGSGLTLTSSGLGVSFGAVQAKLSAGNGVALNGTLISAKADDDRGIAIDEETGALYVKVSDGLEYAADGITIKIDENTGLSFDDNGNLCVNFGSVQKKLTAGTNITISANGTISAAGEPAAYLKSASVSNNTLTLTKKDGTTVTFTPQGGGGTTKYLHHLYVDFVRLNPEDDEDSEYCYMLLHVVSDDSTAITASNFFTKLNGKSIRGYGRVGDYVSDGEVYLFEESNVVSQFSVTTTDNIVKFYVYDSEDGTAHENVMRLPMSTFKTISDSVTQI